MSEAALASQSPPSTPVPPEALSCVLGSRTFEKTPALRALLTYLWTNRDIPISEYAVATECLGRSARFDARTDATVRVQIGRLRQRLSRYYEDEGRACVDRLTIPMGSHHVQIERRTTLANPAIVAPASLRPVDPALSQRRWLIPVGSAVILFLLGLCGFQANRLRSAQSAPKAATAPWLWQRFFTNRLPTRIVLPTPVFFSFDLPDQHDGHAVMFRDTEVNEFSAASQSPLFKSFVAQAGKPTLADNYTVTSDTFASIQLARYLDRLGISTSVNSAAEAPMEALDQENEIAMGTRGTLTPLKPYLDRMDFRLGDHETYVRVGHPSPGEPPLIESYRESEERSVWPGVIAFLPGLNGRSHLLILAGRHTQSLVSVLTSTVGLERLSELWKAKGSPEFFEVIIDAEVSGRGLMRAWPLILHPYKIKA